MKNTDYNVVNDFGNEWNEFDQSDLSDIELNKIFNEYFEIFPWDILPINSQGFDLGCGSGRWAKLVSKKCGHLFCIDPSNAIEVAKKNLMDRNNCTFFQADVDNIPLKESSMDFGYSLGVLHHIPNTQLGINECVKRLKPGAPFLIYLYYSLDNQPIWYLTIWHISDFIRKVVSKLPFKLKLFITQIIAILIYYPLAKFSIIFEKLGFDVHSFPLSAYRSKSFYTMRTDALDRFGTKLESRFSKKQINEMLTKSGLTNIIFSDKIPFWVAVGFKK